MSADPVPSGEAAGLAARLRACREQAGNPSLRTLEALTERVGWRYGRSSLSDVLAGRSRPDWEFVEVFVRACALHGGLRAEELERLDLDPWRHAHREMLVQLREQREGRRQATEAATALRCSLPAADPRLFVGRQEQVEAISRSVVEIAGAGGVVAIHAIDGMPGVGKTALAIHVANLLRERFPDGQLFLDLHAHTPGRVPVSPGEALGALLVGEGLDPRHLPDGVEERVRTWRDRMAGRRVLLVLDDAVDGDQVAPLLLPGGAACLVLVTSRRFLGGLPVSVVPVQLDVLSADEAVRLFLRLAPHVTRQRHRVAELVQVCGRLPLAISLLARLAARDPDADLSELIGDARSRLLTVPADDDRSVAAAFDLSYRRLPEQRRLLFRRLALHPGTETDPYAAAALVGVPVAEVLDHLDALHDDRLLVERGYRRYAMHDLIRSFARRLVAADPEPERRAAEARLLDHYQQAAAVADARLARQTRPVGPARPAPGRAAVPGRGVELPDLVDAHRALAWLRAERDNLLSCLGTTREPRRVLALTAGLTELLRLDGPWTRALALHAVAADLARSLGDGVEEANALTALGTVRRLAGDYDGAVAALTAALAGYRDVAEGRGEANALALIGNVRLVTGDYAASAERLDRALAAYRRLDDPLGRANVLADLGDLRRLSGDYPGAETALAEALEIYRSCGNRGGEANVLTHLGAVRRFTGDHQGARECLDGALELHVGLGNRGGQANVLFFLGTVLRRVGEHVDSRRALLRALELYTDLGDRLGRANSITALGAVRCLEGEHEDAVRDLETAVAGYRELGDRGGEVVALNDLGWAQRLRGDVAEARRRHEQALGVCRTMDSPWDQAHALAGLGRCALADGDLVEARRRLGEASEIFRRIGAGEAAELAAEIAAIG
ncbi:MAG: tetratricopeptide repeat protein [Actinomycetales bacterium]|nr:tetratricopeptide repeat protein [Actinomycetales bacterium]